MTYTPTPAQLEAIKNGATQFRVALDPQPDIAGDAVVRSRPVTDGDMVSFSYPSKGGRQRVWLPFAPGDTFPVGDQTATVAAVRVERL